MGVKAGVSTSRCGVYDGTGTEMGFGDYGSMEKKAESMSWAGV